jgi:[acyl-carrier-protein] S-malonyltransferase
MVVPQSGTVLVVVAPGQGSQTPGFLTPWLELPGVADRLAWLSAVADIDLVRHGTESDAETIRDTAIAQPLLVAAGLVTLLELFPHPGGYFTRVGAGAGHSVGEITAAVGTGVLSAEQAMVFVRERGKAMAAAAAATPTGMTAVLGGDPDEVLAAIAAHGLTAANVNAAGQVVAAGTLDQLAALAAEPPAKAKLRALDVAGAFHTVHMAAAVAQLGRYARSISTHDPRTRLISNADGAVVHDGRDVMRRLVAQVSAPVRWDRCQQTMSEMGVTAVLEIPPAGTLTALAKRALPGVETLAVRTPDDLPAAWDLIERHAVDSSLTDSPTWRLVVAPRKGIVKLPDLRHPGLQLVAGSTVAVVTNRSDELAVLAPHGGTVMEWLVEDGDPVSPGQPLVRLHPEGALS